MMTATMTTKGSCMGLRCLLPWRRRAVEVDAPSAASTKAGPTSPPVVDDLYNAMEKALHLDAIQGCQRVRPSVSVGQASRLSD